MKYYLVILFSLALVVCAQASQRAVTDEGEIVILHPDGTWGYADQRSAPAAAIPRNPALFVKSAEAKFSLKSTRNTAEFWIDPKQWSFRKAEDVEDAEYEFQLKGKDLYGIAITEKIRVGMESLSEIALSNAREAAPDTKMVTQEYRTVNGNTVLYMEMKGTIQGIDITYLGYYYSDEAGSTQYLTYTGSNLVREYKDDIDRFLNGFTVR